MNKKGMLESRLSLKQVDDSDADFLFELYNLSDKRENRPKITKKENKKFVHAFVNDNKNHIFDVWNVIQQDNKNVGSITLRKLTNECGYWLLPDYQNKGIGSWAFNELMILNPRPFYALVIHPYNKSSLHMAEKFGFKLDTYKFTRNVSD